jgi:hypothetical protein
VKDRPSIRNLNGEEQRQVEQKLREELRKAEHNGASHSIAE